jgi:SAM-dependent methyltransferase
MRIPGASQVRDWLQSLPFRTHRQRNRLAGDTRLSPAEQALLRHVDSRISRNDKMYTGNTDHYYRVGLSAIRCIERALCKVQTVEIRNALDLPCGHGRVLRFLVKRFPETRFTVCDLNCNAADFCVKIFGVQRAYSQADLKRVSLNQRFEFIWCGSLITHLEARSINALLEFFLRHLSPGGVVVLTTHGKSVVERMHTHTIDYGIEQGEIPLISASYHMSGFGYTNYPGESQYGISLTSPAWIREQIRQIGGLQEVYFEDRGWDDHQDVFGFVKKS